MNKRRNIKSFEQLCKLKELSFTDLEENATALIAINGKAILFFIDGFMVIDSENIFHDFCKYVGLEIAPRPIDYYNIAVYEDNNWLLKIIKLPESLTFRDRYKTICDFVGYDCYGKPELF